MAQNGTELTIEQQMIEELKEIQRLKKEKD